MKNDRNNSISITVDDFGISETANAAITELISLDVIDRVAIMLHGSVSSEEAAFLLGSGIRLDIHLDMNGIIDEDRKLEDGVFGRGFRFLHGYCFGSGRPEKVREVWESQILMFQKMFGRLPDGFNSHQHVHFFPPYFSEMLSLAKKYGIRHIRFGRYRSGMPKPVAMILDILRTVDGGRFRKSDCATSDYLISADWLPDLDFESYTKKLPSNRSVEFIFHPERKAEFDFLKGFARRKNNSKNGK